MLVTGASSGIGAAVGDAFARAAEETSPAEVRARSSRLRYPAGREARWLPYVRVLLPQRLFDQLVRRGYGLHKIGRPARG